MYGELTGEGDASLIKPVWAAVGGLALLGTASGIGVLVASTGGEEEAVQQLGTAMPSAAATVTAAPTPSATASPEPTAPGETPMPIPADWQRYDDPKGRFSIGIPPGWEFASSSTIDGPAWLQLGKTEGSFANGGAKLEVLVVPKQAGDTVESVAGQPSDPYGPKRLTFDYVAVNGQSGARASWTGGFGDAEWSSYVFERGDDWLVVSLYAAQSAAQEYFRSFDEQIINTFVIQ
jgi:hypothetical protein